MTQQVSHRPIKCQSRLWSQRGTKVNGSHHGDNPLLRPTGIQIATKRYATLQAMAPTIVKTAHQTSLLHVERNLDRLGLLSPTHDQRSQQQSGQITLQSVLIGLKQSRPNPQREENRGTKRRGVGLAIVDGMCVGGGYRIDILYGTTCYTGATALVVQWHK